MPVEKTSLEICKMVCNLCERELYPREELTLKGFMQREEILTAVEFLTVAVSKRINVKGKY